MSIMCLDRFGNKVDVTVKDDVQFPIAQIMEIMEPKSSYTAVGELKPMLEHSVRFGGDINKAAIYDTENNLRTVVKDGYGVFVVDGDHEKQVYDPSLAIKSGTTFFSQWQMPIHVGFLCSLFPELGEVYLDTMALDVNHCIIPTEGCRYPSVCSEFFEMVDRSRNCCHAHFIRKWHLEDSPVSAFDIHRLKDIFTSYIPVEESIPDDCGYFASCIGLIFNSNSEDMEILRRKVICWLYFIKKHTNGNKQVWRCFRQFLRSYLNIQELPSNTEIETYIEKYSKF